MQAAIGYLRVSTREQGRSGLGLAAQRHEIETFGAREGFTVRSWLQDIQTGAGADALLLRPGLATALKDAEAAHCALIVSRLGHWTAQQSLLPTAPQATAGGLCGSDRWTLQSQIAGS